ncbi:MAG: hypothetical protein MUE85_14215 [Microscillaceae bacterium]|jgi:hypothetical protein|nr:hypothetical protein [Microscillaceae bacterium]
MQTQTKIQAQAIFQRLQADKYRWTLCDEIMNEIQDQNLDFEERNQLSYDLRQLAKAKTNDRGLIEAVQHLAQLLDMD